MVLPNDSVGAEVKVSGVSIVAASGVGGAGGKLVVTADVTFKACRVGCAVSCAAFTTEEAICVEAGDALADPSSQLCNSLCFSGLLDFFLPGLALPSSEKAVGRDGSSDLASNAGGVVVGDTEALTRFPGTAAAGSAALKGATAGEGPLRADTSIPTLGAVRKGAESQL